MPKYYTLLMRLSTNSPWGVHFGDIARRVVEAERNDLFEGNDPVRRDCVKIICTGPTQTEIDAEIAKLNAGMETAR